MCCPQTLEKKGEAGEAEPVAETSSSETPDMCSSSSRSCGAGAEGGGLSTEQPFIKLSQEEYGEHHSSIMHCRSITLPVQFKTMNICLFVFLYLVSKTKKKCSSHPTFRVDSSGRRVASLDIDGVIKVDHHLSFGVIQTL